MNEFPDIPRNATLAQMADWASWVRSSRQPDFVIGGNYMRRWWIVPRNDFQNVYLHHYGRSDDDRAFHDHPWDNTSFVIEGSFIELTPNGALRRDAGDVVTRPAAALHRIELIPGISPVTLFVPGPKVREWGFSCPQGWRHWREFTSGEHGEAVGRGCD